MTIGARIEPGTALIHTTDVADRVTELEELAALTDDQAAELASLRELHELVYGWPDHPGDATLLIRDDCFQDHARDVAVDLGLLGDTQRWPVNHIDWESAADALKTLYNAIDWQGTTYWFR